VTQPSRPSVAAVAPVAAIKMSITTTTKNARARIDNGPLRELPLEELVTRDGREHIIYVEADGYVSRTKTVRFDSDLHVGVSLTLLSHAAQTP
jgi:hypothetical protein